MANDRLRVTIKDVAKLALVSPATISRYLNGKHSSMDPEKKRRIHRAIQTLGYEPNELARGLRSSSSRTIGVVVADIVNPYSIAVLQGIETICAENGYGIIVSNSNEDKLKERESVKMLESKRVDGLLINSTGQNEDVILDVSQRIPTVLIDRKLHMSSLDTVTTDNKMGMNLAVNHLVGMQCRRIALIILKPDAISPRQERVQAFLEYFSTRTDVEGLLLTIDNYAEVEIMKVIKELCSTPSHKPRVGLLLGNGILSMMALKAVKGMGARVPDEVMMVGFDDPEWASISDPTLTTIRQPTYLVGVRAAGLVMRRITEPDGGGTEVIQLPVELVQRESTTGIRP